MRHFDLGQQALNVKRMDVLATAKIVVVWHCDGVVRRTFFHTKPLLEFGRESTADGCLRIEPIDAPGNKEASLKISRRQFRLLCDKEKVQIVDLGSAYGTKIGSNTLAPNDPVPLESGAILDIAGVLKLSVHIEREGERINTVRLRRMNNLPGTEYVCLIGHGVIDIGENSLLRLPLASSRRQGRIRTLDIGEDKPTGPPALILNENGGLFIKRTGNDTVTVNDMDLLPNQSVPIPQEGKILIGNSIFTITKT